MALPSMQLKDLTGFSVLVVEDEYFVASDSARALRDHGARILGPVPDVQRARELLAGDSPDVVLLDVNLKGEMVYELAEELRQHGVPMIFATGYDAFVPSCHLARRAMPAEALRDPRTCEGRQGSRRAGVKAPG